MAQGTRLIGRRASACTPILPLQKGGASFSYVAPRTGPVAIAIANAAGDMVRTQIVQVWAGRNRYVWDGHSDQGVRLPDGQYAVAVQASLGAEESVSLETCIVGIVTGVVCAGSNVGVSMGEAVIPFQDLRTHGI